MRATCALVGLCVLLGTFAAGLAQAATLEPQMTVSSSVTPGGEPGIDLDARNMPVQNVLRGLGRDGKVEVVLDPSVVWSINTVNLDLHGVTVREAIEAACTAAGLSAQWGKDRCVITKAPQPPKPAVSGAPATARYSLRVTASGAVTPGVQPRINVRAKDATAQDILRALGEFAHIEVVLGPGVDDSTNKNNVDFHDVSVRDAIETVCAAADLSVEWQKGRCVVTRAARPTKPTAQAAGPAGSGRSGAAGTSARATGYSGQRPGGLPVVNIEARNTTVGDLLKMVADMAHVEVEAEQGADVVIPKVDLRDVNATQALDLICASAGLRAEWRGGRYLITRPAPAISVVPGVPTGSAASAPLAAAERERPGVGASPTLRAWASLAQYPVPQATGATLSYDQASGIFYIMDPSYDTVGWLFPRVAAGERGLVAATKPFKMGGESHVGAPVLRSGTPPPGLLGEIPGYGMVPGEAYLTVLTAETAAQKRTWPPATIQIPLPDSAAPFYLEPTGNDTYKRVALDESTGYSVALKPQDDGQRTAVEITLTERLLIQGRYDEGLKAYLARPTLSATTVTTSVPVSPGHRALVFWSRDNRPPQDVDMQYLARSLETASKAPRGVAVLLEPGP